MKRTRATEKNHQKKTKRTPVQQLLVDLTCSDINLQKASLQELSFSMIASDVKKEISDENGVPTLLTLLSHEDDTIKKLTANVLWNLTIEPLYLTSTHKAYAISQLIPYLMHEDETIIRSAVGALRYMAVTPESQLPFITEKATPRLLQLLQHPYLDIAQHAANTLILLSNIPSENEYIQANIDIPAIIEILQASENNTTRTEALIEILLHVSYANKSVQTIIYESNGIPVLVALFDIQSSNINVLLHILSLLAEDTKHHESFQSTNIIHVLMNLLHNVVYNKAHEHKPSVHVYTSAILCHLSAHESCFTMIAAEERIIPFFIELLQTEQPDSHLFSLRTITKLITIEKHQKQFINSDGMDSIAPFIKSTSNLIQNKALTILTYLASIPSYRVMLRSAVSIPACLALLAHKDHTAKNITTILLWFLASESTNHITHQQCRAISMHLFDLQRKNKHHVSYQALLAFPSTQSEPTKAETNLHKALQNIPSPTNTSELTAQDKRPIFQAYAQYFKATYKTNLSYELTSIPLTQLKFSNKVLGRGGFGDVYQGKWLPHGPVAIKRLLPQHNTPEDIHYFHQEAEVHGRLHHPNVVALLGVTYTAPGQYRMVLELMSGGTLYHILYGTTKQTITAHMKKSLTTNIANGLTYLHQQNVLHCDFKSPNILLDANNIPKISDFGTSVNTRKVPHTMGTYGWMAPEIINEKPCTKASDVYSFGVVVWEIITQKIPFRNQPTGNIRASIRAGQKVGDTKTIPNNQPKQYANLITACWEKRAEDRPTIEACAEILKTIAL